MLGLRYTLRPSIAPVGWELSRWAATRGHRCNGGNETLFAKREASRNAGGEDPSTPQRASQTDLTTRAARGRGRGRAARFVQLIESLHGPATAQLQSSRGAGDTRRSSALQPSSSSEREQQTSRLVRGTPPNNPRRWPPAGARTRPSHRGRGSTPPRSPPSAPPR